jgi:hypothetical protein
MSKIDEIIVQVCHQEVHRCARNDGRIVIERVSRCARNDNSTVIEQIHRYGRNDGTSDNKNEGDSSLTLGMTGAHEGKRGSNGGFAAIASSPSLSRRPVISSEARKLNETKHCMKDKTQKGKNK